MKIDQIKATQERIGVEPDGFWGPISTAAAQAHLRRYMARAEWQFPTQREVSTNRSIFGPHGVPGGYEPPAEKIELPFPLHLYGDPAVKVRSLLLHPACAPAFLYAFNLLADAFPTQEERQAAGILNYDGVYAPRPIRGGSSWSMHSYRIALDLDSGRNGNSMHWPVKASMPIVVMECFAAAGLTCAGAMWSRDAMHTQAAGG